MIVIGYQGIGKSTMAHLNKYYIDLESGCFWIHGKRAEDWYKPYCKMAEHISAQGHCVFVSSHEVVRNELKHSFEKVVCCVPAPELKDAWIERLRVRYEESKLDKDYRAWKNAEDRYEENIKEIANSGFPVVWIKKIPYDLSALLIQEKYNA